MILNEADSLCIDLLVKCVVNVVKWAISWRELFAGFVRSSFIVWCRFECESLIPYARICYVNVLQ